MSHLSRRSRRDLRSLLGRAVLLAAGGAVFGVGQSVFERLSAERRGPLASVAANLEIGRLESLVDELKGRVEVTDLKAERLTVIGQYSAAYRIPADLAGQIYDAAMSEGLHPSLGYQLVKVESGFRRSARSNRSALGLTQVRLATARELDAALTEGDLMVPDTNLRIGFRVLRRLLRQFDNDLELALAAYNLGPTGAAMARADTTGGVTPAGTDYASKVMGGMKKRALIKPTT